MREQPSPKILDLPSLVSALDAQRREGKVIVQCHGCFDLVHPGHIRYLKFAKEQGDVLVVSLTGDSAIDKGPTRPYVPQELRAESLAALEFVDYVTIDPNPTACEILEQTRPDRYVKGREYQTSRSPDFLTEREIVERHGGRVVFSSGEVVFSSTELIAQLDHEPDLEWQRLRLFCRRNDLDSDRAADLLDRMAGKRVLVVGDTLLDRYVFCDAVDVASESPMMSLNKLGEQSYVGGAAIVARHIAGLGGVPFLVTAIGQDANSRRVREVLVREDIDGFLLDCRQTTVEKTRYLVEESKLFKVEQGKVEPLDSVSLRRACQVIIQQRDRVDAVILCDFGYGMLSPALTGTVIPELRRGRAVISGDVSGHRADLLAMGHADLLCPTERELRAAVHDFDSGLAVVAHRVMQLTRARHLCVTLGKDGLVVFDRPSQDERSPEWCGRLRSEHLPSMAHRTTDRLGCGDALLATMTLAMTVGATPTQAAYLGSGAAAIELACLGNLPVDHDALRRWLATRTDLSGKPRLEFDLMPVR